MNKKITSHPIPNETMIAAINQTQIDFPGYCCDKWGESEAAHCRRLCGPNYRFVETDWIRMRAQTLRKGGKLNAVNGGPKRKKVETPNEWYENYLKSDHWRAFRDEVFRFWGGRCCLCKEPADDVHHNTYIRICTEDNPSGERLTDCVALCRDCHVKVHGAMPSGNEAFTHKESELF